MSELVATGYCDLCGSLWSPAHECPVWALEREITEMEEDELDQSEYTAYLRDEIAKRVAMQEWLGGDYGSCK